MTLLAVDPSVVYAGSGSTGPFSVANSAVPIYFRTNSHIKVVKRSTSASETTLVENVDYTLTGGPSTGAVTLSVALAVGEKLVIYRDQPYVQDVALAGNFSASDINAGYDHIVEKVQEIGDKAERSFRISRFDAASGINTMLPAAQANALLSWNAQATAIQNVQAATFGAALFPSLSTDNAVVRFDGTGGLALQNSGVTIDDSDVLNAAGFNLGGVGFVRRASSLVHIKDYAGNDSFQLDGSGTNYHLATTHAFYNKAGNVELARIDGSALRPGANNALTLGDSTHGWAWEYAFGRTLLQPTASTFAGDMSFKDTLTPGTTGNQFLKYLALTESSQIKVPTTSTLGSVPSGLYDFPFQVSQRVADWSRSAPTGNPKSGGQGPIVHLGTVPHGDDTVRIDTAQGYIYQSYNQTIHGDTLTPGLTGSTLTSVSGSSSNGYTANQVLLCTIWKLEAGGDYSLVYCQARANGSGNFVSTFITPAQLASGTAGIAIQAGAPTGLFSDAELTISVANSFPNGAQWFFPQVADKALGSLVTMDGSTVYYDRNALTHAFAAASFLWNFSLRGPVYNSSLSGVARAQNGNIYAGWGGYIADPTAASPLGGFYFSTLNGTNGVSPTRGMQILMEGGMFCQTPSAATIDKGTGTLNLFEYWTNAVLRQYLNSTDVHWDNRTGTKFYWDNAGTAVASLIGGEMTTFGSAAAFTVSDRSTTGTATFYRSGGINRLYDSTAGDTILWRSNSGVGNVGINGTPIAGAILDAKAATDKHIILRTNLTLADGMAFQSVDDANAVYKGMEFGASQFLFSNSGIVVGAATSGNQGAGTLNAVALYIGGAVVGQALTKTDDTNITLTLGGTPTTSLVKAASLTLGWTGTLAAGRLNANVVQAITNDTNITGSIATQTLTLGWTGTLAVARGGTGTGSAGIGAFNNITGLTAAGTTGTTSTNLVFSTSPTLVTPALGVASATSLTASGLVQAGTTSGYNLGAVNFVNTGSSLVHIKDFSGNDSFQLDATSTTYYLANAHSFYNKAGNTLAMQVLNGMVLGAPTGGDKGTGSLNVAGDIYKNNAAYTNPDYVFEHEYTGTIVKFADRDGAKVYGGRLPLSQLRAYTREHLRLPGISDEPSGMFARGDMALEKIEELALYIMDLEDEVRALKRAA